MHGIRVRFENGFGGGVALSDPGAAVEQARRLPEGTIVKLADRPAQACRLFYGPAVEVRVFAVAKKIALLIWQYTDSTRCGRFDVPRLAGIWIARIETPDDRINTLRFLNRP